MLKFGKTLWVSAQSNATCDMGSGYDKNWEQYIHDTKNNLGLSAFKNEDLKINFRNSNDIFNTSNDIDDGQDRDYKIQKVLGVPTAGTTTISSCVPKIFNFNWINLKSFENYQSLFVFR